MKMIQTSLSSRFAASILVLAVSCFGGGSKLLAQDISGGASVLLASADVEAKLGKGIFTTPQNRAHAPKHIEKKTVARSTVRAAHARQTSDSGKQTTDTGKQGTDTGNQNTDTGKQGTDSGKRTGRTDDGLNTKPLGDPATRVLTAEEYNKRGDNYFDNGQYEKA